MSSGKRKSAPLTKEPVRKTETGQRPRERVTPIARLGSLSQRPRSSASEKLHEVANRLLARPGIATFLVLGAILETSPGSAC